MRIEAKYSQQHAGSSSNEIPTRGTDVNDEALTINTDRARKHVVPNNIKLLMLSGWLLFCCLYFQLSSKFLLFSQSLWKWIFKRLSRSPHRARNNIKKRMMRWEISIDNKQTENCFPKKKKERKGRNYNWGRISRPGRSLRRSFHWWTFPSENRFFSIAHL